jgi:glucose/arabinose dehydrogenase
MAHGFTGREITTGSIVLLAAVAVVIAQQKQRAVDVQVVGHITKPQQLDASDARIGALQLPPGFRIQKFAEGLGKPRILAVAPDGAVYVTRRGSGDLLLLRDENGDGVADGERVVAQKPDLHGVAIKNDRVYLATIKEVFVADRVSDGSLGALKRIMGDLPDGGQHPNRTLGFGPDGMLYVSVGSTCNACTETSPESATLLRAALDGSTRKVFASGLRNTIGFAWHPQTNELWAMDHGIDWLGDNEQGEELIRLTDGAKYGWPYIYGKSKHNPADEPPGEATHEQWAKESQEPVLLYTAHAAPMQMVFYTGEQFPPEYRNDAFVTMRGSWNRKPPSGYEVVRVRFENGKPTSFEPFLRGFLNSQGQFGRPVGLAVARDGSLLIGDDTNGVIYRVTYGGGPRSSGLGTK